MGVPFKYNRRRSDNNVDDWLMTYADMITLLLCFFAIFLSVSVPKDEQMKQAKEKVLEEFAAAPATVKGEEAPAEVKVKDYHTDLPYKNLPSIIDRYEGEGQYLNRFPERPETPEGDRLITLDIPSAAFFPVGSAALSPEGMNLLSEIVTTTLSDEKTKDYQITVEGHTDDSPISTAQFPSNWELSTARAASVVRFFIEKGISPQRLRASGYADSIPKLPNRDADGKPLPDHQAQNRRVVIRLEKIEKSPSPQSDE